MPPSGAPVDDKRRYDLYLTAASAGTILPAAGGGSAAHVALDAGDLASKVFDGIETRAQRSGRIPSLFYAPRCVQASDDEQLDATLQTRGGGVALFVIAAPFLDDEACVTQLARFLHMQKDVPELAKAKLRLALVGLSDKDFRQHALIQPLAPRLDRVKLHPISVGTLPQTVSAIVELAWQAWLSSSSVLGKDVNDSLLDMLRRVFREHETATAKLVFGIDDLRVTTLADVFSVAISNYMIGGGYEGSAFLDKLVTSGSGLTADEKRAAVAVFKRKWVKAGAWGWDSDQRDELNMSSDARDTLISAAGDRAVEAALRHGTAKLRSVRVLLMGGSTRGKTSTVSSLLGHAFVPDRESTVGIELETHYLVPGSRGLSPSEVKDRAIRMESYASAVSRVDEEQVLLLAMDTPAASSSSSASAALLDPIDAAKRVLTESSMLVVGSAPGSGASDEHDELRKTTREAMRAPVDIEGENGHLLRIWDFGGQKEYEMCHQLFISQRSVLMFAVDLQKLWCKDSREEEFDELLLWLKCAFTLTEGSGVRHVVVVGTRKNKCDNVEGAWEALEDLISSWSDTVYDAWVCKPAPGGESRMRMIALENDGAIDDAEGSGLLELEKHLWSITKQIIESSQPVPVRWRALLEKLVRAGDNKLFLTKKDIVGIADGFPGFEQTSDGLELTVMTMLRYFRDLGELVLFEMSSETEGNPSGEDDAWIVFVNPDKLLSVLRAIIGPCRDIMRCLKACQKKELQDRGLVDMDALDVLWENCVPKRWRLTMVNMLCSFDLLVKLEWREGVRQIVGIPVLMPCLGRNDASFEERIGLGHNEQGLKLCTVFTEFFPSGLIGVLVANLHKTIGRERTTVQDFRADAVLLSLNDEGRVLVRYVQHGQGSMGAHIKWWFLGRGPVGIAHRCLRQFNALMRTQFRKVSTASYKHLIIWDCVRDLSCCIMPASDSVKRCGRGCGEKGSVKFEVKSEWLSVDVEQTELFFDGTRCNQRACGLTHDHAPLKDPMQCCSAAAGPSRFGTSEPSNRRYDLLISCHDVGVLQGVGHSAAASSKSVVHLARRVGAHVTAHARDHGRKPIVFFRATRDDMYDGVMQLRGGGVGLFLLSREFFRNEHCMATLLSCMDYAKNGKNGSGVQLRLVYSVHDFADIFDDETAKSLFPNPEQEKFLFPVEAGTVAEMSEYIAQRIVWEAWTGEKQSVLGGDIEQSFRDLTSAFFFGEECFSVAKSVLQVHNRDLAYITDVFEYAKVNNRVGYHKVGALRDVTLYLRAPSANRIDSAISAYESKWLLARTWEWGSCEKDRLKNVVARHLALMKSP